MATITEELKNRTAHHLISEASDHFRSREQAIIASGAGKLAPGTVLGKITASGKYVLHDVALANGAEVAAAVLFGPVDATSADARCVVNVRDCVVHGWALTWKAAISDANKLAGIAALNAKGIQVRD